MDHGPLFAVQVYSLTPARVAGYPGFRQAEPLGGSPGATDMLQRTRDWLERIPLADPSERRQAATVQLVCFLAIAWCVATLAALAARGFLDAYAFDAGVLAFGIVPALVATVALLRAGRYRGGLRTGVACLALGVSLLHVRGLEYSAHRFVLIALPLAAAALLLGRAALWAVLLLEVGALGIGALRDAGHLGGPGPSSPAVVPLGFFSQATITFVALAIVLDRFGGLLRDALRGSRAREGELEASEERFRTLSSLQTEGVMVNADGVVLDANDAFARLAGVESPAELIGKNGLDVIPFTPASRELVRERIRVSSDEPYELELRRPHGGLTPVEVSARSILFHGREARLVVMRDISFRKAVEAERARRDAELRASEERFRLAFATSPDAMNLVRVSDGVYVEVNDAFVRATGWSAAEMVGRTSADAGLWVDRAQRAALSERMGSGEPVHDVEAQFRRKDGRVFTGLLSARTVTISGVRYVLGIVRDVTERKRAEQERDALRDELRQAQKMEAIGRLAGGVAHDFNNVLTSILASTHLLADSLPPDHPSRPDVQQIESDAQRAAELTRQLLSFARKQDVAPQVIRIEERARTLEKMLRRVMGAGIVVETSFAPGGWPTFVDPGQVEQLILNLAVNARDAMREGGRLTIATENVTIRTPPTRPGDPPPGDHVLLTVVDTGEGMTADVLAHAFEPFFTTKGDRGTGLGLATCFGIVAQAGGTISVESAPGAGTRFRIHLPRAAATVGSPMAPRSTDLHGSETILVVEDDSSVRRLAVRSLSQLGYEVLDAASVSEARSKVSRHEGRVDCIVMDVELPDGSGLDAAVRILAGRPAAPVLLVSGSPVSLDERGPSESSRHFMPKPYAPIELARRVRTLLDRSEAPAAGG